MNLRRAEDGQIISLGESNHKHDGRFRFAMTSRAPTDKRGRVRAAQVIDAAAEILAETNDLNLVTTTSVAEKSGLSIAMVYRYFADRDEIIEALFARETAGLDELLVERFLELDSVTVGGLMRTMIECHYEYFLGDRRASTIWFGTRANGDVADRVNARYSYIAEWFMRGALEAGLVTEETPSFGGELIVWMGDAALRYIFSEVRSEQENRAVIEEWLLMVNSRIDAYTTPRGREGLSTADFIAKVGLFDPPKRRETPRAGFEPA